MGAIQDAYQETVGDNLVVVDTYVEETIVESETKFKVVVVVEALLGFGDASLVPGGWTPRTWPLQVRIQRHVFTVGSGSRVCLGGHWRIVLVCHMPRLSRVTATCMSKERTMLTHYQTYPKRCPRADLPPKKVCNLGPMALRSRQKRQLPEGPQESS